MNDDRPLIVHVFDGFRVGGTEVRTCHIINSMQNAYRHVVVSNNGDFSARALIDGSISIEYIHPLHITSLPLIKRLASIASWLRDMAPQLLVAYEWGAIDWVIPNLFVKVCPTIMTIEGFEESELVEQNKRRAVLRRFFYKRCDKVVACSQVLIDIAIESWKVTEPGKLLHIPNGINCAKFSAHPQVNREKINGFISLGIVASLIKLKNHHKLLQCVASVVKHVAVRLYIVGDGPERENLQRACRELGIAEYVIFTGLLRDPENILQQLDIFCLSSDTEQMPMVVLEAMATGLPIVSTDVGDVREMVAEENKDFIVDKSNTPLFVEKLLQLCVDKKLRQSIGLANYHKCRECYDEQLMFQRYRDLYSSLISSRN